MGRRGRCAALPGEAAPGLHARELVDIVDEIDHVPELADVVDSVDNVPGMVDIEVVDLVDKVDHVPELSLTWHERDLLEYHQEKDDHFK